jgi:transcription termination factor Rho
MSEPQLERSVLEAKEREELYAIADALGTKPGSRAKKSDLIAQILRATGVETDMAEPIEKPRRTRARKVAAPVAEATDDAGAAVDAETGSDAAAPVSRPGRRRAGVAEEQTGAPSDAEQLALGTNQAPGQDTPAQAGPNDGEPTWAVADGDHAEATTTTASNGSDATAAAGNGPVDSPVVGDGWNGGAGSGPAPDSGQYRAPEAHGTNGAAESAPPRSGDFRSNRTQSDGRSGRSEGQGGSQPQSHGGQPQHAPQPGNQQPGNQQSAGAQSSNQQPGNQQPGGLQTSPQGVPQPGPNGDRQRFDSDPGNRRNRRRRGRDRTGTERTEHDLQGAAPEQQPQQFSGEPIAVKGLLDLRDEGYGFLRTKGFLAGPNDVYVSISQVRRFALRKGDQIEGACRPAATNEKYPALLRIDTVTGLTPDEARQRPKFEDLTPLFPDEKLRLEVPGDPANMTARIVDLISPIGKGQRGLIVSPPKAGKTTVLKQIAHSIEANNPEVHLMVLLVDERPEEVTDMRRSVKGEVIASTFDRPSDEHTQVAELTIERAKRLVEIGKDVVIVLDGITRLARAYNLAQPATGRIMSGGIDTGALYPPKKFFGSARNIEEGGSLTILATALVETGSRMDEVIFEEFKGTGNMELRLDRKLAERRIYPALDVNASSTRHEELLFDRTQLQQVWKLRRVLNALGSEGTDAAGLQLLMDKIKTTRSNDEFLAEIAKTPAPI